MRECVQLRERKIGANHPDYISSLNALAIWTAEQADVGVLAGAVADDSVG
jgi:hypothetical protein